MVNEYLKILLKSDDVFLFKNILTVTFKNKAANEMKERVLKNLLDFSFGTEINYTMNYISMGFSWNIGKGNSQNK